MIRTASRKTPLPLFFATAATLLFPGSGASANAAGPKIVAARSAEFAIGTAAVGAGQITQFSFGPGDRLYASTIDRGIVSYGYDAVLGVLTDPRSTADVSGAGIAFHSPTGLMYVSSSGAIYRLSDNNGNGQWGEPGETRVAIVQNLPIGDHMNDNLQIVGDTLSIGIGDRTINGGTGRFTGGSIDDFGGTGMVAGGEGNTFGESAYNGTIAQIRDLKAVASTPNAAGLFSDTSRATIQTNDTPFTSTDPGKLTVHSAGTRNPFGLAVDRFGDLFFTNNYNRATTNGDGTASRGLYADAVGPDFRDDVHDQFFKAVEGADYGFRNENYRGRTPILTPGSTGYNREESITFDNLDASDPNYLQSYDPANPVGLGPSSSTNGLAFSYNGNLAPELSGNAFAARFVNSVTSADGQTLRYADLVAINPTDGAVRVIADGFINPLAVFADVNGNLLVSDFGNGSVYFIQPLAAVPEPASILLALTALPALGWAIRRRRRARVGRSG